MIHSILYVINMLRILAQEGEEDESLFYVPEDTDSHGSVRAASQ